MMPSELTTKLYISCQISWHTNQSSCLINFGNTFARRFQRTAELADVETAISDHNEAVRITAGGHPN
jgi:hypothetical protein